MKVIESLTSLYEKPKQFQMSVIFVANDNFKEICKLIYRYKKYFNEVEDEYWINVIKNFSNYNYSHLISAIPFSNPSPMEELPLDRIPKWKENMARSYPDESKLFDKLLSLYETLFLSDKNPLLEALIKNIEENPDDKYAVHISAGKNVQHFIDSTKYHPLLSKISILNDTGLRQLISFEKVYTFSPPFDLKNSHLDSPRTQCLIAVLYEWVRSDYKPVNMFSKFDYSFMEKFKTVKYSNSPHSILKTICDNEIINVEIRNRFDEFEKNMSLDTIVDSSSITKARTLALPDGEVVFLEHNDKAKSFVIIPNFNVLPDENSEIKYCKVKRISNKEITKGMYVLLDKQKEEGIIRARADKILGSEAKALRSLLHEWKSLLSKYVNKHGIKKSVSQLEEFGSERANTQNLRNWKSPHRIKTGEFRDFKAILNLISYTKNFEDIWKSMEKISTAHMQAGRQLINDIKDEVLSTAHGEVLTKNIISFKVKNTISMTAYEVEDVSPNIIEVDASLLGNRYRSNLWQ